MWWEQHESLSLQQLTCPRIVLDSASPYSALIESPKGSLWAHIWTHSFVHAQVSWEVSVSRRRKFDVGITGQRVRPSTLQGCTRCGWKHCVECLLSITQPLGDPEPQGIHPCLVWMVFKVGPVPCKIPFDCEWRHAHSHQSRSYTEGQCWRAKELRNGLSIAQRKIGICHKPDTQSIPTLRKPPK